MAALLVSGSSLGHATSCVRVNPCERIRPESVLFIGTVIGTEDLPNPKRRHLEEQTTCVHMNVKEIFAGLSGDIKEVTVEAGKWLIVAKDYLLDARRNPNGTLSPTICGQSGAVDESDEFLRYLRRRQKGSEPTSLTVQVSVRTTLTNLGLADAVVLIRGPNGRLSATTDRDGKAVFDGIVAGGYSVVASKSFFRRDAEAVQENRVEVLPQTCPSASVYLRSESSVEGRLRTADGKDAPNVTVELVAIDPERMDKGFFPGSYGVATDGHGRFDFENVFPGRYLLGTNIRFEDVATSTVPRAYYPGRLRREEAAEIVVAPGARVNGLQFILPDVGARRTIRIRRMKQDLPGGGRVNR